MIRLRFVAQARFRIVFENLIHIGVSHALGGANHAGSEIRAGDLALGVDLHDHAHYEPLDLRIERANAIRKFFGEHRHRAHREINRSAAQASFEIDRGAALYVMRDVGNMHLQFEVSIGQRGDVHGVVEISRRFAINRDDWQIAEIASAAAVLFAHLLRHCVSFGKNVGGEFMRQVMLADYDFGVYAGIAGPSENFDHTARWSEASFWKSRELHIHNCAIEFRESHALACDVRIHARSSGHLAHFFFQRGQKFFAGRNYYFVQNARIVGMHGIALRTVAEKSHDRRELGLDDLNDASIGPAIIASPLDARENGVAMHGVAYCVAANEKVAVHFWLLFGVNYESVAIAMRDEAAGN